MTGQGQAASSTEHELMAQVADEYRRRGYEVILEPRGQVLPTPVRRLSPDLIAVRGDDRVAVIVKRRRGPSISPAIPDISALQREGWRTELFFADQPSPPIASPGAVIARAREATQIAEAGHSVAGMLLVWSAAEEALRVLASRFAPSESGRKILTPDQAYSIGLVSQNQHRALNYARDLRNQVAHNIGSIPIPDYVIRDTAGLLERMVQPSYVPPPIMADRVLSQLLPDQDVLEQVNNMFPDADPVEQVDAAEYVTSLRRSSEE